MARGRLESAETAKEASDRRSAPRLDKVFPVFVEGDRGSALGIARNISAGGMFVETRTPESLGSQVRITFGGRDGEMTAIAEVRYVCHLMAHFGGTANPHRAVRGMGVRFLYFDPTGGTPLVVH